MGRYTSIQAYMDNANMRSVPYEQATGTTADAPAPGASASASAVPNNYNNQVITEKVDNPYGSTAGAGSGEFHVYRHARAREAARWKQIHENDAERQAELEFRTKVETNNQMECEKTTKRRKKRERAKDAKRRKKNMKLGGVGLQEVNDDGEDDGEEEEEEFVYTSVVVANEFIEGDRDNSGNEKIKADHEIIELLTGRNQTDDDEDKTVPASADSFPNDGTFLERMKEGLGHC